MKATLSGHSGWTAGRAGGDRFFGIGDGLRGLVIDFDQVDAVGGDVAIGGHDDGDRMSDEVDAVLGEDRMMRHAQAGQRRTAGHGADGFDIGAGEDGDHAGAVERGLGY